MQLLLIFRPRCTIWHIGAPLWLLNCAIFKVDILRGTSEKKLSSTSISYASKAGRPLKNTQLSNKCIGNEVMTSNTYVTLRVAFVFFHAFRDWYSTSPLGSSRDLPEGPEGPGGHGLAQRPADSPGYLEVIEWTKVFSVCMWWESFNVAGEDRGEAVALELSARMSA